MKKRPIISILICLCFGILLSYSLRDFDSIFFVFLCIFGIVILPLFLSKNIDLKILFITFFIGFSLMFFRDNSSKLTFNENVKAVGDIVSVDFSTKYIKYKVDILKVEDNLIRERTILTTSNTNVLNIGDRVEFFGKFKEIYENTNPKLFNFKRFYLKQSIYSKIYCEDLKKIGRTDNAFLSIKSQFQKYVENTLDKSLNSENSDIMKRLLLGNKYEFDFESETREIGVSHILAISGLHIGIIYILLQIFFKYLPISRLLREIFILLSIFLYAILIGNPSSVLRAAVYISVLTYTKFTSRIVDNLNALLLTLFIILILNPYQIFDIGLYLSFLSVFSIIVILPRILRRKDGLLAKSLKTSFAISLILLPVLLNVFGEFSLITFIGNLVIVPFFVICIVFGFFILFLALIHIKISVVLGFFVNFLLDLIKINVEFLSIINFKIKFYDFNIVFVLFYYLLIFAYFSGIYREIKLKRAKFLLIAMLVSTISLNIFEYERNLVKINFIDIGQGDSILIRGRYNNILIDTGGITFGDGDNGSSTLVPYLKKEGVSKLNYVFISHIDADHCKNLNLLSEEIEIENLIFRNGGYKPFTEKFGKVRAKNILEIKDSQKIHLKDMELDVFQVSNSIKENEKSILVNLTANGKNVLFTGDIGAFTENQLLKKNIKCDYLKVAHHGSKNSSSISFLNATRSKNAIISCGKNNRYGHPHKDTIERIESKNMKIYRTDKDGNVILNIDRDSEKIFGYMDLNIFNFSKLYSKEIIFLTLYLIVYLLFLNEYRKMENNRVMVKSL